MMSNYNEVNRFGRKDGRRIRSLNGFWSFIPYIMPSRNDALNFYSQSFEISNADRWFRQQRTAGYKGMGMLHLFIAAYVRAIAVLPGLNRFIAGRHVYAHNDIEIVMAVKPSLTTESEEVMIKVRFDPTDTIYDVYEKLNNAIDDVKTSVDVNDTEAFANIFAKLPRPIVRFIIWIIKVLDYFGLLPKKLLDLSPFHGTLIISDLGSLGLSPVFHHIYNIGTLPVFMSFGAKRHCYELDRNGLPVERKYVDTRFTLDERIVDGQYYAAVFKVINSLIADPSQLEVPPETVNEDKP